MINMFYLVIFMIGAEGITSQSIPQANMKQCQVNAKFFNENKQRMVIGNVQTNKAYCIAGVK